MNPEILDYIKTQRVGVLAVQMLDGSPHASAVHVAHTENLLIFLFETYREYCKAEPLFARPLTRASLVLGCNEQNMKTLQMDGAVRLMTPQERKEWFDIVYLEKFPEKRAKAQEPKVVPLLFTPTWWRCTDWTKPEDKLILTSTD